MAETNFYFKDISDFKFLQWAFSLNKKNFLNKLFAENCDNPYYLPSIDEIFKYLKDKGCNNVPQKLQYVNSMKKFNSSLSELEIAKELIEKGKNVQIILDNDKNFNGEPDLFVKDSKYETYIEVTRITYDESIDYLAELLEDYIRERDLPYVVDVDLNRQSSIPAFFEDRKDKRESIQDGFNEFQKKLYVEHNINDGLKINTKIGCFKFRKSRYAIGYAGIITSSAYIFNEQDNVIKLIRQQIIKKAKKRELWTNDQKKKQYVVILDFESLSYDPDYLKSALIGNHHRILYDNVNIEKAIEKGWTKTLEELEIIPNRYLDPKRMGIFFTDNSTKNISAVIGKFRSRPLTLIPNPFCADEINDPRYSFLKMPARRRIQ